MLDFSAIADFKTPPQVVMAHLGDELDAFLYTERTGVKVMEDIKFPWKKVLGALEMTVETVDQKKVSDFLSKEFEEWLKTRPLPVRLEPEFAKILPNMLQTLLKDAQNEMKMGPASIMVASWSKRPFDTATLAHVSEQIRLFIGTDEKHFQLSGQTLYRIADDKGRSTDVAVRERGASSVDVDQTVRRFTSGVRDSVPGMTRDQFYRARKLLGGRPSIRQLRDFYEKSQIPAPESEPELPAEPEIHVHPLDALADRILEILMIEPEPVTFTQLAIAIGPQVKGHVVSNEQIKHQMKRLRIAGRIVNDGRKGPGVTWWAVKPKGKKKR